LWSNAQWAEADKENWAATRELPKRALEGKVAAKIKFEFKESSQFRIVHTDGVFGGPTPHGNVYASFYNERLAMPVEVSHTYEGGRIGEEILEERKVADAVERTMEVALIMNLATAKYLRDWLSNHIASIEAAQQSGVVDLTKQ
jgi:hypothetical protein